MTDWPSQESLCYVFGVPRVLNGRQVGLTEVALLRATDPASTRRDTIWVPVATDRTVAEDYYQREHPIGHSVVRFSNPDGLWALWLELLHLARRYEAEGMMVIRHIEPELYLEPFPAEWFLRQYLSRCRPLRRRDLKPHDVAYLKGTN